MVQLLITSDVHFIAKRVKNARLGWTLAAPRPAVQLVCTSPRKDGLPSPHCLDHKLIKPKTFIMVKVQKHSKVSNLTPDPPLVAVMTEPKTEGVEKGNMTC